MNFCEGDTANGKAALTIRSSCALKSKVFRLMGMVVVRLPAKDAVTYGIRGGYRDANAQTRRRVRGGFAPPSFFSRPARK